MKNKMEDLRNHLFAELERIGELKEPSKTDLDKAKAVSDLAGKLIDTARVEVDFHKVRSGIARGDRMPMPIASDFIEGKTGPALTALPGKKAS